MHPQNMVVILHAYARPDVTDVIISDRFGKELMNWGAANIAPFVVPAPLASVRCPELF